jgi:hypothetical protein
MTTSWLEMLHSSPTATLVNVLAAGWIGLHVEQAQHLLLGTTSLSVLCYDHDVIDEPAIALWNSATHENILATNLTKALTIQGP